MTFMLSSRVADFEKIALQRKVQLVRGNIREDFINYQDLINELLFIIQRLAIVK